MREQEVRLHLGARLRKLRKTRGLSQEELAARAGLHRNFVGMLDRSETSATTATLIALANAFGIPLAELLDFHAKIPPPSREEAAVLRIVRRLRKKSLRQVELFEAVLKLLDD